MSRARATRTAHYTALPTAGHARLLRIALLVFIPARVLVQVANYSAGHIELETAPAEVLQTRDGVLALLAGVSILCVWLPIMIGLATLFSIFFYRANSTLRACGVRGLEYTPGWAAGWFYVPLANLVLPHAVASELWRASEPLAADDRIEARGWTKAPVPRFVHIWWILFVAALVSDRAAAVAEKLDASWGTSVPFLALQLCLWIPAALYARRVVKELETRVTARFASATFVAAPEERWN
jgi:hypothetical protein